MARADKSTASPDEPQAADLIETEDLLKRLERQSGGSIHVSHEEETDSKKTIDTEEAYAQQVHTGHVGSVLFVCVTFMIAVAALLFISPITLLVNNKEQLVNDLNDGLYAYYTYTDKVLGGQLGARCDEETIKCKFGTMSPLLKEQFENYGFKLANPTKAKNKRYKVAVMTIPGGGAVADELSLKAARRSSDQANTLINKVYSSRTSVYQDRQFYQMLLARYGLQQSNTLSGDTRAEFDEDFDRRVKEGDGPRYKSDAAQDPSRAAETGGLSADDSDSVDKNGRGVYSLGSLAETSGKWQSDIYTNLVDMANTHLSLACGYATYGRLTENSLARAKMVSMTRFAMNYLAVADDLKSGEMQNGGEIAVESLSEKLTKANSSGKNAMDADSYRAPALGESIKNVGDILLQISPLKQLLLIQPGAPSASGSTYLRAALTGNIVQNGAKDRSDSGLCAEGMSGSQYSLEQGGLCWSPAAYPLAQYIGFAARGIIAAAKDPIERVICPLAGVKPVVDMVKNATRPEITATLPLRLQFAASYGARDFKSSVTGIQAQNIIFAGTGQILGDRAQTLGMRPASAVSLTLYLKQAESARTQQEQESRTLARSTPWDIANPYSFMGTVVAKLMPGGSPLLTDSWRSSTAALLSSLPVSFGIAANSSAQALYTQPMHFQPARFRPASLCGIPGLDAEITPDFACNVRYSMSPAELNLSISEILDYMTKPHPDDAKESLQQVQARDTSADPVRGNKMKQQASEGANAAYIDPKTGKPNKYTEYAKFLEYCTNRYDPWGRVGMSVQLKDVSDDHEKDESQPVPKQPSPWGDPTKPVDPDRNDGNVNALLDTRELDDSYYALGWGSKKDQDWYTGKQCANDSDPMMKYFRGYTMACSILASMSGTANCWDRDVFANGHDDFYTSNNIIFKTGNNNSSI